MSITAPVPTPTAAADDVPALRLPAAPPPTPADADVLPGRVFAGDAVAADRILTKYLRTARALELQTTLLTAADGGRHIRLWLRRRNAGDSPEMLDQRVQDALGELLSWRVDGAAAGNGRHNASPPARALADAITLLGAHGDSFVQLGRAVFVNADSRLAGAVLTDQDLAYLEDHPELVTSPRKALARMRAAMKDRYLDLTQTVRALTNGRS